jgi:hypothetical protein
LAAVQSPVKWLLYGHPFSHITWSTKKDQQSKYQSNFVFFFLMEKGFANKTFSYHLDPFLCIKIKTIILYLISTINEDGGKIGRTGLFNQ